MYDIVFSYLIILLVVVRDGDEVRPVDASAHQQAAHLLDGLRQQVGTVRHVPRVGQAGVDQAVDDLGIVGAAAGAQTRV